MNIYKDKKNPFYTNDNRELGNCYTIEDGKNIYHYEFEINGREAKVKYDSILKIKDAIFEFRKEHLEISVFYNEDRSFYQGFEDIHTFKLPIAIIQPSQFFIDQEKLDTIAKYLENEKFYFPVCIIDDEYVLLDGHARMRYLLDNDYKMVDVYMKEPDPLIQEYVYIAKENNLFKIKQLEILSHEEYLEYLSQTGRKE